MIGHLDKILLIWLFCNVNTNHIAIQSEREKEIGLQREIYIEREQVLTY